jgi:excisionase family DNA binding protein
MLELFNFSAPVSIMAAADDREISKLLYSRKDAAFALSISIRSLDYLVAAKQLKFRKVGRKILIPASELSRYARADHSCLTQHPEAASMN